MSWITVALLAYLFLAVSNLFDKFLIDHVISSSKAYAFVACLLGGIVVVAAPWLLEWPGWRLFFWDVCLGFIFALALWFLYEALKRGEAAKTLVLVGGVVPVFSILLSVVFLKEKFNLDQWGGLGLLVLGTFLIAFLPSHRSFLSRVVRHLGISQKVGLDGLFFALISGVAYALYFVGSKYAFNGQSFASAFIWARLGAAFFVLLFLLQRKSRREIFKFLHVSSPQKHKFLVLLGQGFGSLGFILQNYAIFLGSVALVNALQGVQYAFILLISAILAFSAPKMLKESFTGLIILQKTAAVFLIGLGLYFIAL
ncbi:MAG: EamA family transporter [Patescibacteria group bacterium]